ncbi:MAG: sodium/solute symporter [Kiritimatiellales bacterium]
MHGSGGRWQDFLVLGLGCLVFILVGIIVSRKNKSADDYFLAGRNMPGWLVGFSVMATLISSMSFLANPGFAYAENWRQFVPTFGYILACFAGIYLFMPFFRMGHVNSAYEYLEKRFGSWARFYAAAAFLLIQFARVGVILYALCLAIQKMVGLDMVTLILLLGGITAVYTIIGGFEAIIWVDVVQGLAMFIGAFICLPILIHQLPGGFGQIFDVAIPAGKFSLGEMSWNITDKTFLVMLLISPIGWLQIMCTDQTMIQRYIAPKSKREARKSIILGGFLSIPLWIYFFFIGTALYVFYAVVPGKSTGTLIAPEQILPYFIMTEIPAGLAGFVMLGIIGAGMSTLSAVLNATAATMTNDYYRRIFVKNRSERHYLRAGFGFTLLVSIVMIGFALLINSSNSTTLNDLQTYAYSIFGGGLLGLFLLGLLTKSVNSKAAAVATCITVSISCIWTFLATPYAAQLFPAVAKKTPNAFLLSLGSNLIIFLTGLLLSRIFRKPPAKDLTNLTIWSTDSSLKEVE